MKKIDLPKIIFFQEKVGSNGIHCLDYKNDSDIKYIREDVTEDAIQYVITNFVNGTLAGLNAAEILKKYIKTKL